MKLAHLFCLAAVMCCCMKRVEKDVDKPNVILIYADDLGRGLLSYEGQKIIKTPNIDLLANEGMRFERAYGAMLCAPARASLLTGYHDCRPDKWKVTKGGIYSKISSRELTPGEVEATVNKELGAIPEDEVFLAQVFKKAGYATGQIGKLEWGFASTHQQMERHGWDYYYGYLDHVRCHGFYPPFLFENRQLVPIPGNTHADCGKSSEPETPAAFQERWNLNGKAVYSQQLFLDKMLSFIRQHKDEPFFLYHPTQLPHGPVSIPSVHPDFVFNDSLTSIEKEYASMVKMLDDHVGIILDELNKLGIADNTIVIFSADNGHEIYYPKEGRITKPYRNMQTGGLYDNIHEKFYSGIGGDIFDGNDGMAGLKRSNWEGGVRIPLIVRWPGKIDPGAKSNLLVANFDLMATFADLLKIPLNEEKDSKSFLPALLHNSTASVHDHVVYSSFMGPALVTQKGWKLRYFAPEKMYQLYYLPDDHREEKDLISVQPHLADSLKKTLLKACGGDIRNGWYGRQPN